MHRFLILLTSISFTLPLYSIAAGPLVSIDTVGTNSNPQIAVADNGNAFAVWLNFPNFIEGAAYVRFTNTWTAPVTLAQGSVPVLSIDGIGNTIIVFVSPTNQILALRFNAADLTFSGLFEISVPGTINSSPRISMNAAGLALAIWIQSSNSIDTAFNVKASTFDSTNFTWSTPVNIFGNVFPASYVIDNINTGIAIFNNSPTGSIQASTIVVP